MIGRQEEITVLQTLAQADKSAFVAVYGRRRVGKTYLVRTVFENKMVFQLTGLARTKIDKQLANFHAALVKAVAFIRVHDLPTGNGQHFLIGLTLGRFKNA